MSNEYANEWTYDPFEDEQNFNYPTSNKYHLPDNKFYLKEADFYFSSDDRAWKSYIEDIDGGDNFVDYCGYIFELLEEEGYYD